MTLVRNIMMAGVVIAALGSGAAMAQDEGDYGMQQDGMQQDGMQQDSMRGDGMQQDRMQRDGMHRESMRGEGMRGEGMQREGMNRGGMHGGGMGGGGMGGLERFCSMEKLPDGQHMAERITGHLDLRDAQKPALKDLKDTFAKSMTDARTALCNTKFDMSTPIGRLAFVEKKTDVKLQGLKNLEPKLQAFYNVLDDNQKMAFNEMKLWHGHHHHHEGGEGGRHEHENDGN